MVKTLVVVESPAKAKTIKKYLGSGFDVVASKGHIKDLPKKLGVDIEKGFQETYEVVPGKEKVLHFRVGGGAPGDDFQFPALQTAKIRLLHEHASEDALELKFAVVLEPAERQMQKTQVLFCSKNFLSAISKAGRNDTFDKQLGHFFSGDGVDDMVESENAAESGKRVAGQGLGISVDKRGLLSAAAVCSTASSGTTCPRWCGASSPSA